MEFEKINLEKSWNFVCDLKHYETNFCALRMHFKYPEHMHLYLSLLIIDFSQFSFLSHIL